MGEIRKKLESKIEKYNSEHPTAQIRFDDTGFYIGRLSFVLSELVDYDDLAEKKVETFKIQDHEKNKCDNPNATEYTIAYYKKKEGGYFTRIENGTPSLVLSPT